jgi:hypothetical protein
MPTPGEGWRTAIRRTPPGARADRQRPGHPRQRTLAWPRSRRSANLDLCVHSPCLVTVMTSTTRCFLLGLTLSAASGSTLQAQAGEPSALRVYVDCQTGGCDFDYFRTSIPWVDWMRERQDAHVAVLVTSQSTGGGGAKFTLTFDGRGALGGRADTLTLDVATTATDDEIRRGLVQRLRVGLVPFAARTRLLDRVRVSVEGARADSGRSARDPWNYWVFSVAASPYLNGEASYKYVSVSGEVTATRVTPTWKTRIGLSESYTENRYELADGSTRTILRSYAASALAVRSLSAHWSAGLMTKFRSSTYSNYDVALRASPGIEYDVFPYGESTRRQLTLLYTVGADYLRYHEPTIFQKTSDRLLDHAANLSLELRQPWGSVSTSVEASQFLTWRAGAAAPPELRARDGAKYAVTFSTGLDVRLVRGLSLYVYSDYARIHNQVALPAAGASNEDILLRLRQLETSYEYYVSSGLRFTFGSIHNNIVNPRFSAVSSGHDLVLSF